MAQGRVTATDVLRLRLREAAPSGKRLSVVPDRDTTASPTIVAVAGGGADAYPMLRSVLDAAEEVHADTGAQFLLVTGPFMPGSDVAELRRQAKGLPMTEVRRRIRGRGRIARADLVVSMAGYNTTVELLNAGTPALLIRGAAPAPSSASARASSPSGTGFAGSTPTCSGRRP